MKISWRELNGGKSAPKWYGYAYADFARALDIFYPMPINWIVRYWLRAYWGFLKTVYWVGLIDMGEAEVFSWCDFYRIKAH